jgi:hypothetical protein
VVRILRKIPPEALSEDRLNRLRNAVTSPEVLKALSHVGVAIQLCGVVCAASARGASVVYRVLEPERATLSLIRTETGRWEIGELKASRNRPVSEQTQDLVEQWLGDWQLSSRH